MQTTDTPTLELPEIDMAEKLQAANDELDTNPFRGPTPLLEEHPLTKIVTGFFETLGQTPADRWISGSDVKAVGGVMEVRALINNELRRILSVLEFTNQGTSFDMRYLLNRDSELELWLQTLYQHVCPFIVTNSLLEPIEPSSLPEAEATTTD